MTSCRLVATSMLSSNPSFQCYHLGARQWIEKYLKDNGGWADLDEIGNARSSLSIRDNPCRCKVIRVLKSSTCKNYFLVQGRQVCLMSSYESGLRKMKRLLEEGGPVTMSTLREKLRRILTEDEERALGRTRRELKSTISTESVIFATEQLTGLVVLRGVHAVLDPSCCHSGVIQWIEQYLKEHAGWASIDEMNQIKSELFPNKLSCQCTIRSLIILPNIRKHFHVQGKTVFTKSYYQSGLQKVTNVLEKNGPQKLDELLHMLKEAEVLSETELRALGDNEKDFAETISKEPQMFQPLSQSGRVHLKAGSVKPCRHRGMIKWIKRYLKKHDVWVSIEELTAANAKIPARDGVCSCEISTIILDDKLPFHVQGNQVCLWSSVSSNYESGIKKMVALLRKKGPQPVGILLNMLKQAKIIRPREEKVIGRNKKELAYTITREPMIFKFVSPPGIVMLRDTHHEDGNQVTKVVEYLEKYLRTCKTSYAKTLLNEVVRHEALSTGCIAGKNTLKKLLAAYPDRFVIHGDGSVSLTESRRMALSDTTKSPSSKRNETSENESRNEIVRVGHSAEETAQKRAQSSSTEDMNSSNSKPLDVSDTNNNIDAISRHKQREHNNEACQSESSRDLDRGLRFVEKLLKSNGPMVLIDIHTSIVATFKLDMAARRILGRTPEELLSILLLQKDTFHVIPPSDLVVLRQTNQMSLNPWTTGLKKVREYLLESHQLSQLVGFMRENLTAKERQVLGDTKKKVKRTIAHYQDVFLNQSGVISLRYAERKLSCKEKRKKNQVGKRAFEVNLTEGMRYGEERMEDDNPCKKPKHEPNFVTAVNTVVVHVVESAEEWFQACRPLFESVSSVVSIDCDSKWFVLRQWDGIVIATKIQSYLLSASPPSTITAPSLVTSVSSKQKLATAKGFAEPCANSQEVAGEHMASNKLGEIFHHLSLLLASPSILKVVYDIQRICAILCEKMPLSFDNVFDVKVANQLINPASLFVPNPASFAELCEMYSVTPSAVVHVTCPMPGGVDAEDMARLKNMAVMTSTLIPHFLHKMFRDMKVELLTEHNCIVEELCSAWGPGFLSGRCPPQDLNTTTVQEQGMSLSNMHVPNPHLCDPFVLNAEELRTAQDSGFQGRHHAEDPNTTSLQEQELSLTNTQLPNSHLPDPRVLHVEKFCNAFDSSLQAGR